MSLRTIKNNLLFWKVSFVFTALLISLGIVYIGIASHVSKKYFNEVMQQLNGNIALQLASSTHTLKNGITDTSVTHDIIHSIMVANPSVEAYIVDTIGRIIDFVGENKSVKKHSVDLAMVKEYIADGGKKYLTGENPKELNQKSIFSAAAIYENRKITGYVYAILASEKQSEVLASIDKDLFYNIGTTVFFITLLVTFLVGIITFFLITGSVCKIASVVKRFKEGDYSARIHDKVKGNLWVLSTTFNEMADVIVENMNRLTSAERMRQELIANVSHDLRSPLAIMQGYIETLIMKDCELSKKEKDKYLEIIFSSSTKLSRLVDQLFQYSKLEANEVRPQKEPFLLSELVLDILAQYEIVIKKKAINLKTNIPENLPVVFADVALVERVIQNLLDNALKFTPEGGEITISLKNQIFGVEVSISDTGPGVAQSHQSHIFERFEQLSDPSFENKGMGLGLAIVKKILLLHNSNISIESIVGSGTTFFFLLPVQSSSKK